MADKVIAAPFGSVSVTISLKTAKDGNKALAEARANAVQQAAAQGRKLNGDLYGTKRDGDDLTITFPLAYSAG